VSGGEPVRCGHYVRGLYRITAQAASPVIGAAVTIAGLVAAGEELQQIFLTCATVPACKQGFTATALRRKGRPKQIFWRFAQAVMWHRAQRN